MNPASGASPGRLEGFETSTLFTVPASAFRERPPRFRPGERIAGRFRVLRLLGQGGTAQVYEAEDAELGQRVALKVIRPEKARSERAARLLRTEVLLARKVTHPGVCRIFDLFLHPSNAGPVPVISMELLPGETLKDRLRRGSLSPAEALPLVRQMTEALDAAHRVGVVHRDFKSGNVMLVPSPEGPRAVVTDFGLARSTGPEGMDVPRPMVGTPAYMAPEQVLGEEASPAADLYALGIVLYEMVTGALPFQGDSSPEIARKRLQGLPPRPSRLAPDLPAIWDEVILRCLERDPVRRFRTAGEVVAALEPSPASRPFAWVKIAALCLTLTVPAGFAMVPLRKESSQALRIEAQNHQDHRRFPEAIEKYSALWTFNPEEIEYGLRLAEAQAGAGEKEAFSTIEKLRGHFGFQNPQIDLTEAKVAYAFADFHRQLEAARRAEKAGQERGLPLIVARAFLNEGEAWFNLGRLKLAEEAHRKARQAFSAARDREGAAEATFRIGSVLNEQRRLGEARQHLEEARLMFQSLGDRAGEAWVRRALGKNASYEGDWKGAESLLQSSVALFHELGRRDGEALAGNDLALVLRVREAFPEAEAQYDQSLALARAANDKALEGLTLAHLGELVHYRDLGEGRSHLEKAIAVCQEAQYKHCLAIAHRNLGDLLLATAEFEEAEKELIRARKLATELGNPRVLALIDLCLAAVYLEQGRPQDAELLSTARLSTLTREGLLDEKGMALILQAQALLAQGKPSEARNVLKQALPLAQGDSPRMLLRIARIYTEAGDREDARRALDGLPKEPDKMSEVEASLARKILDLETGQPVCLDLAALEGEARARGLLLLAHRAAQALGRCEERYLSLR